MQKIKICTVVTGKTVEEFCKNLEQIQEVLDLVELRVDYIKDLKPKDIPTIKAHTKVESIFTCRHQDEGGKFTGSEKERLAILHKAAGQGFEHIDVELLAVDDFDRSRLGKDVKLICSYHDFGKTPDYDSLSEIADQIRSKEANIIKIATMAQDDRDVKTLMKLLANKAINEKMIVIGMGEEGRITRIIAPLYGSYLTFASVGDQKTAPGQVDIEELREIYTEINLIT